MSALVLLTIIAATPAAAMPDLIPASRPALVVAVTQDTRDPLDAAALKAVDRAVAGMWNRYADVSVRDAGDPLAVMADDVLTVRITDRRSNTGDGLGWIDFIDGQPSRTIWVSRTEITELAQRGKWGGRPVVYWPPTMRDAFVRRAVAVAIGHEIGHYLLRSKLHSRTGLMRAGFTVEDVMRGVSARTGLDAQQQATLSQRMRGYLLARSGQTDLSTQ
jgi:hypothetical protein